ncbi:MAG: hypothetical protein QXY40_04990 [Candidatus Methanomethylicia archaeon]
MREYLFIGILVLAVLLYAFSNQNMVFITGERWGLWSWNHGGYPSSFYGYAELPITLTLNNTNNYWVGNVSQQGYLTYFTKAPPLLGSDIENLYLKAKYIIHNASGNIVHVGIALYVKLPNNYLAVDLFLYASDLSNENYWYNPSIDPDYHAQYVIRNVMNEWVELDVNVSNYIERALRHYGLKSERLETVQFYVEGVNCYGNAEFYDVLLYKNESITNIVLNSKVLSFVVLAIILYLLVKMVFRRF